MEIGQCSHGAAALPASNQNCGSYPYLKLSTFYLPVCKPTHMQKYLSKSACTPTALTVVVSMRTKFVGCHACWEHELMRAQYSQKLSDPAGVPTDS